MPAINNLHKSPAQWERMQAKADNRFFKNRSDAIVRAGSVQGVNAAIAVGHFLRSAGGVSNG